MNIIICTSCEGGGKKKIYDDYNDWSMEKCEKCNGTGRLKTRSYSYHVPFSCPDTSIYNIDARIIDLIRKLEKNG